MLQQIEKFWHDKKLKNRNEAIRQLITIGLENEKASI
jgi:metal-responsive CopG/Arc/MetJ family transcriptional regulator